MSGLSLKAAQVARDRLGKLPLDAHPSLFAHRFYDVGIGPWSRPSCGAQPG